MNNQIKEEGLTDAYLLGKYDGIKQGKADAIDECIKKLKLEFHTCLNCISYSTDECNNEDYFQDCCVTEKTISFVDIINFVKQLKEQNNLSCFDCEHHFMSDCYLECNKHNRINDNKICDDFEQLKERNNDWSI